MERRGYAKSREKRVIEREMPTGSDSGRRGGREDGISNDVGVR